jgi:hypothetical protein
MNGSGKRCTKCGATNADAADSCVVCGGFLVRNQVRRESGLYAVHQPVDIRLDSETLVEGVLRDLGGADQLPTIERGYTRHLGDAHMMLRLLLSDIAKRGAFTPSGRVRDVVAQYWAGLDRFDRFAQRLRPWRRQKPVSLDEALAAVVLEQPEDTR